MHGDSSVSLASSSYTGEDSGKKQTNKETKWRHIRSGFVKQCRKVIRECIKKEETVELLLGEERDRQAYNL